MIVGRQAWLDTARPAQLPPDDPDWRILLFRTGRGWGKSTSLNHWFANEMLRCSNLVGHCIAPTASDLRSSTFEGPSGLCDIIPSEDIKSYSKTRHELRLNNGSVIWGFAATENTSKLRGAQAHVLIGDDLHKWDSPYGNLEMALTNAMFGLRLKFPDGTYGRTLLAATPAPAPYLLELEKRSDVRVVTGTSWENQDNLSPEWLTLMKDMPEGSYRHRQEIKGEYIHEIFER